MRHMLRQAVIVTAAIFLSLASYAQDIIVTTDARKIEAKITEVSKSEIRYKETDNPDGPTFVLGVEDISTIIYSNGKVVLYNQPAVSKSEQPVAETTPTSEPQQPVDESLADIFLLSGQTIRARIVSLKRDQVIYMIEDNESTLPATQIEKVLFVNTGQVKTYNAIAAPVVEKKKSSAPIATSGLPEMQQSGRIYRDNNQYFYNNTYISKKEVERILERENSAAYRQWKKADGLLIGGAVCTGIGGGLVLGGLIGLATGEYGATIGIECCALVPLGVGLGLCFGASANYNKAIDIYNSRYDHAAIELRWRVSPAEIGFAIAF